MSEAINKISSSSRSDSGIESTKSSVKLSYKRKSEAFMKGVGLGSSWMLGNGWATGVGYGAGGGG